MANFNFNKAILGGRLTADPELKTTQTTGIPVVTFTVAINRRTKTQDTADFIRCRAYNERAQFISQYFHKGSTISVVGHIQVDEYTDRDGKKCASTIIVCDEVTFVDSKEEKPASVSAQPFKAYVPPYPPAADNDPDDLPF